MPAPVNTAEGREERERWERSEEGREMAKLRAALDLSTREGKAADAYLEAYSGPWGLKASSEDALLQILVALYPEEFPQASAETIEKLRANERLGAVAQFLWEELECEGMDEKEISSHIVPKIDEAMAPSLIAEAMRLGYDVEFDRYDPYFLACALAEVRALPEEEKPAAIRALNDGATVADRENYREGPEGAGVSAQAVRHPEIEVELTGSSGNASSVLGKVSQALRRAGVPEEERDEFIAEATSGDYDHLLQTAMRWVEVS